MDSFFAHAGVISEAPRVSEILLNVLQFLLSVIGIVAILALVIAGIRYVLVQGNADSAANVKKSITAIVLGLIAILASLIVIWQVARFLS